MSITGKTRSVLLIVLILSSSQRISHSSPENALAYAMIISNPLAAKKTVFGVPRLKPCDSRVPCFLFRSLLEAFDR